MTYRVDIPVFSGPLDLLLHLIKQQEVDIHEVSIANILEHYLQHLNVLQTLDLTDIGDFLVMASTLMEIKSRDLLPGEEIEIEEELDPRDDLIRRLLEYKRFRDASRRFDRMSKRRARMLVAGVPMPEELAATDEEEESLDLDNVEIWALTAAFAKLLEETGVDTTLHVGVDKRNVRFYTERILGVLRERREVQFEELFDRTEGRYGLIGVFTACLEMMKQGFLRAHQENSYGPILLHFRGPSDLTADEVAARHAEDEAPDENAEAAEAAAETNGSGPTEAVGDTPA